MFYFGGDRCKGVADYQCLFEGLKRNGSIRTLEMESCNLSQGTGRGLVVTLGDRISKLQCLSLFECRGLGIGDDGALLAALRQFKDLKILNILFCNIALVPAIRELHCLEYLNIWGNDVGRVGCEGLASLLQDPRCNLHSIFLASNQIDDICTIILTKALRHNISLVQMNLTGNGRITSIGCDAFSKALCNTASINGTYLSNHTLQWVGERVWKNLSPLLTMNKSVNKSHIAIKKILNRHRNFDMEPFLKWNMKVLPLVVVWFDKARACTDGNEHSIEEQKVSAIYQFIHAMPEVYARRLLTSSSAILTYSA